jgi:hypothetical protein
MKRNLKQQMMRKVNEKQRIPTEICTREAAEFFG